MAHIRETVKDRVKWNGVKWNGVKQSGVEWSGFQPTGIELVQDFAFPLHCGFSPEAGRQQILAWLFCGMTCMGYITNRFGLYDELSDNRGPKRFVMYPMQVIPQEQSR